MNRESAQESGCSSGWLGIWFFVVLMPICYVLSIGPVGAIAKKGPNASWVVTARKFYYPVMWLGDHTPLKKPLEAYFRLWV
jgi:hypothetical protein